MALMRLLRAWIEGSAALRRFWVRSIPPLRLGVCSLVVTLGALAQPAPAWSITVGQIDDFQDGTTQGWGSGALNPNPPINVPDVGPAGIGDHSLQITSIGGFGAGSRLTAFNAAQWAGDYLTPEVTMIVADVNNVGVTTLDLRLAFDGPGGRFVSTASIPLATASGWQTVGFPITGADLTSVAGLDVNATLGNAFQLRLISAVAPSFMGDPIVAQLLVDNIEAVPEPGVLLSLGPGLMLLGWLDRRRRRRAIGNAGKFETSLRLPAA
jgi:hypothetical protein